MNVRLWVKLSQNERQPLLESHFLSYLSEPLLHAWELTFHHRLYWWLFTCLYIFCFLSYSHDLESFFSFWTCFPFNRLKPCLSCHNQSVHVCFWVGRSLILLTLSYPCLEYRFEEKGDMIFIRWKYHDLRACTTALPDSLFAVSETVIDLMYCVIDTFVLWSPQAIERHVK